MSHGGIENAKKKKTYFLRTSPKVGAPEEANIRHVW